MHKPIKCHIMDMRNYVTNFINNLGMCKQFVGNHMAWK